jgi:hypothetical protein
MMELGKKKITFEQRLFLALDPPFSRETRKVRSLYGLIGMERFLNEYKAAEEATKEKKKEKLFFSARKKIER